MIKTLYPSLYPQVNRKVSDNHTHIDNTILTRNRKMKISYKLRTATMEDKRFMIDLERITLAKYIEKKMDWSMEYQENIYNNYFKPNYVSIIIHSNQAIGALSVLVRRKDIYIFYLYLLPQFQKKGIGTSIIKEILKRAKKERKPIILSTFKESIVGKKMADRFGFQITGEDALRLYLRWTPSEAKSLG